MKGFIRQSFRRQIFVVFLCVTLCLVIIGGILTVQGFQARVKDDHAHQDEEQAGEITKRLQDIFRLSENVLKNISENVTIVDEIHEEDSSAPAIYSALYSASDPVKDHAVVDVYVNGKCKYTTGRGNVPGELPTDYAVLREIAEAKGKTVYAFDPENASSEGSDLLIGKTLFKDSKDIIVIIRIGKDNISGILSSALNAKDGFMLTNSFLRPFCLIGTAQDRTVLSKIRSNLFAGALYNNDINNNVYITEIGNTGLLSIYVTPPVFEESAVRAGYQILMFQVVISIVVCFLAATMLSNLFTKPINTLYAAMKRFRKGDFDVQIEMKREDEFGQLATGFNKMTGRLKITMNEMVAAERKVNETKIEMMQAQLNPHFLYNTLDTIKWVAKANQVPEIATLSTSLAAILRTSISGDSFITLKEELEVVKSYCDIQKIRFDDSFDLDLNVSKDVEKSEVPKLILQPIVENSIIHGFSGKTDGHISINAAKETGQDSIDILHITVTDNGAGISDEMIRALENDDQSALSGHLGLNNVNTIIRLYYGGQYGIHAKRPESGGTVMTVILPFKEM